MELVVFWLITILAGFGINITTAFRIYKDIADAGYKINSKNVDMIHDQLKDDSSFLKMSLLEMIIPVVNVMQAMNVSMQYNNKRHNIIDQFRVMNSLEEMTSKEKEEYSKRPTGYNAFKITEKERINSERIFSVTLDDNVSKIYFAQGISIKYMKIVKVTGPASQLNEEQQNLKLGEQLEKMSIGEYMRTLTKDVSNELELDTNNTEESNNMNTREKIEELTKSKEDLLGMDNKENKVQSKSLKNNKK